VLLSGGTSKGAGDLSYRVVSELTEPGIVAHGVALKPGKPICLAAHQGKPVVILPGFPTSAIFTFHEFVAPVIRALGGRPTSSRETVQANLAVKVNSQIGRTEYLLVGLVQGQEGLSAYPMGKGSGSVTTFSRADGFVTIARHDEIVEAGAAVTVQRLGRDLQLADLVAIGSHCVGLDYLLGQLQQRGFHTKLLTVGSTGGLHAARRGECDVAGVHLLDPETSTYNAPFLSAALQLQPGYRRLQGIVHRSDDARFAGRQADEVLEDLRSGRLADCMMVNRNQGSGTRILIDRLLQGSEPPGYAVAPRSHNAVAAAVTSGRADWGVAIDTVARHAGLSFIAIDHEQYDFVIPKARRNRPAVEAFCRLLDEPAVREALRQMGFEPAG
jgi:putative molybdopterin biosynthesis protein